MTQDDGDADMAHLDDAEDMNPSHTPDDAGDEAREGSHGSPSHARDDEDADRSDAPTTGERSSDTDSRDGAADDAHGHDDSHRHSTDSDSGRSTSMAEGGAAAVDAAAAGAAGVSAATGAASGSLSQGASAAAGAAGQGVARMAGKVADFVTSIPLPPGLRAPASTTSEDGDEGDTSGGAGAWLRSLTARFTHTTARGASTSAAEPGDGDDTASAPASAMASQRPPLVPPAPPAPPSTSTSRGTFAPVHGAPAAPSAGTPSAAPAPHPTSGRVRIDPTRTALAFGVVLTLVAGLIGVRVALAPTEGGSAFSRVTIDEFQERARSEAAQSAQSGAETQSTTTTAVTATPVVTSATVLSWSDDDGDHPDQAIALIDNDPSTSWHSRWYELNQFTDESAVTIVVKFASPALVHSLHLDLDATTSGGEVVVRNGDADNPRLGTELTTSALQPSTDITLPEPVETSSIALTFRTMPTSVDGRAWAWVSGITVE